MAVNLTIFPLYGFQFKWELIIIQLGELYILFMCLKDKLELFLCCAGFSWFHYCMVKGLTRFTTFMENILYWFHFIWIGFRFSNQCRFGRIFPRTIFNLWKIKKEGRYKYCNQRLLKLFVSSILAIRKTRQSSKSN